MLSLEAIQRNTLSSGPLSSVNPMLSGPCHIPWKQDGTWCFEALKGACLPSINYRKKSLTQYKFLGLSGQLKKSYLISIQSTGLLSGIFQTNLVFSDFSPLLPHLPAPLYPSIPSDSIAFLFFPNPFFNTSLSSLVSLLLNFIAYIYTLTPSYI